MAKSKEQTEKIFTGIVAKGMGYAIGKNVIKAGEKCAEYFFEETSQLREELAQLKESHAVATPPPQGLASSELAEKILLDHIGINQRGGTYLTKGYSTKQQILTAMEVYLINSLPIKVRNACDILQNICQLLLGIKPDAVNENWWSEWDESVLQSAISLLKELQPFYNYNYEAAPQTDAVEKASVPDFGICKEKGCKEKATVDYNGHGYFVCKMHYKLLNDEFDEEYK